MATQHGPALRRDVRVRQGRRPAERLLSPLHQPGFARRDGWHCYVGHHMSEQQETAECGERVWC
jgi:hypothetical protein